MQLLPHLQLALAGKGPVQETVSGDDDFCNYDNDDRKYNNAAADDDNDDTADDDDSDDNLPTQSQSVKSDQNTVTARVEGSVDHFRHRNIYLVKMMMIIIIILSL